jgi:hypothetical protein
VRHVPGVEPAIGGAIEPPGTVAPASAPFACATCGAILNGDPEDDPTGDAGLPICGECDRSRNFDVDVLLRDEDDQR